MLGFDACLDTAHFDDADRLLASILCPSMFALMLLLASIAQMLACFCRSSLGCLGAWVLGCLGAWVLGRFDS
jgi:hypothetical protein